MRLLDDQEIDVQAAAIEALGQLRDPRCAEVLIPMARKEQSSLIKHRLVESLSRLRDPRAIPVLIAYGNDPSSSIRKKVADALWWIRDPMAIETLEKLAQDTDDEVAVSAFVALGYLQSRQAKGILEALTEKEGGSSEGSDLQDLVSKISDGITREQARNAALWLCSGPYGDKDLLAAVKSDNVALSMGASLLLLQTPSRSNIQIVREYSPTIERGTLIEAIFGSLGVQPEDEFEWSK